MEKENVDKLMGELESKLENAYKNLINNHFPKKYIGSINRNSKAQSGIRGDNVTVNAVVANIVNGAIVESDSYVFDHANKNSHIDELSLSKDRVDSGLIDNISRKPLYLKWIGLIKETVSGTARDRIMNSLQKYILDKFTSDSPLYLSLLKEDLQKLNIVIPDSQKQYYQKINENGVGIGLFSVNEFNEALCIEKEENKKIA